MSTILDDIMRTYGDDESLVLADGFDEAVIGIDMHSNRLIYSVEKCLQLLISQGSSRKDAVEYFAYNVSSINYGLHTPIWCCDNF